MRILENSTNSTMHSSFSADKRPMAMPAKVALSWPDTYQFRSPLTATKAEGALAVKRPEQGEFRYDTGKIAPQHLEPLPKQGF